MSAIPYKRHLLAQRLPLHAAVILALCLSLPALTAPSFEVTESKGVSKIQRTQKRSNETVTSKTKVQDNDIIETYFQASVVAMFGKGNVVILGPNSKALFAISERQGPTGPVTDASFTLFNGGICVKAFSRARVSLYTPNAVCETDSGSVSVIVETRTNETGFQVLGGRASVRNIAQQTGRELSAGQTSMVLPGREPTAPLFLTNRHVTVLQIFFGDDYINTELQTSNITPTEDLIGESRIRLSDNLAAREQAKGKEGAAPRMSYERPFRQTVIWGRILDDRQANPNLYERVRQNGRLFTNNGSMSLLSSIAYAGGTVSPAIALVPSYRISILDAGLRISMARDAAGRFYLPALGNDLSRFLDLVDHVTIGSPEDSLFLTMGRISDYTLGRGILVDRFDNAERNSVLHPSGLYGKALLFNRVSLNAFTPDITSFSMFGAFLDLRPLQYHIGAGYILDRNQYQKHAVESGRFVPFADTLAMPPASAVHAVQADLGMDLFAGDEAAGYVGVQFAQRLFTGGNGTLLRLPDVSLSLGHVRFDASLNMEWGRLTAGQFNWYYPENRWRATYGDSTWSFLTPSDSLPVKRKSVGIMAALSVNPARGSSISLGVKHDLNATDLVPRDTSWQTIDTVVVTITPTDTTRDTLYDTLHTTLHDVVKLRRDFDFYFSVDINDSLLKPVKLLRLYMVQSHGALYPSTGTYFSSWGLRGGIHLLTNPLVLNVALEAGFEYLLLDLSQPPNNSVDPGDRIYEASLGLHWGFF